MVHQVPFRNGLTHIKLEVYGLFFLFSMKDIFQRIGEQWHEQMDRRKYSKLQNENRMIQLDLGQWVLDNGQRLSTNFAMAKIPTAHGIGEIKIGLAKDKGTYDIQQLVLYEDPESSLEITVTHDVYTYDRASSSISTGQLTWLSQQTRETGYQPLYIECLADGRPSLEHLRMYNGILKEVADAINADTEARLYSI